MLRTVVIEGEAGYAWPDLGGGKRVNVEFVSANPTGPLHAGGGRWAAYGDALVNLLNHCGYRADREYYPQRPRRADDAVRPQPGRPEGR
ncbi:MAG: hypothetical protein R2755_33370 [Acidimicrobiales bacterium]